MDWVGCLGLIIGIIGLAYGYYSDRKRKSERELIHVSLINLKPSIESLQDPNKDAVIRAINNMLEALKPPKKGRAGVPLLPHRAQNDSDQDHKRQ
jgi:hypothetical protein